VGLAAYYKPERQAQARQTERNIVRCDKILYSAQLCYQTDTTWRLAVNSAKNYASGAEILWLVRDLDRRAL
jgi:hypothetical protein